MEGIIMPLIINTNVQSLNSQRQLVKSGMEMSTAMERLSSGKRINGAGDDAAGLAIASRMTSQVRGLTQAVRNANDGISLIQTAGGALSESTNILQRMRELAIQSANGIYTDANRTSLNAELEQLKAELTRIAETTSFNGLNILDGTLGEINLQVGSEANQTIGINIGSGFDAESLGAADVGVSSGSFTLASTTGSGQSGTSGTLEPLTSGDLTINGVSIPAASASTDTISTSDNTASALAIAAAINSVSDETGVVAEAVKTSVEFATAVDAATDDIAAGDLKINGVDIGAVTLTDNNVGTQSTELITAINAKSNLTGVTASISGGKISFTAVDGRNIQVEVDGDAAAINDLIQLSNSTNNTYGGVVTLRSNESIDIAGNDPASLGFTSGAVEANSEKAFQTTSAGTTFASMTDGDLIINGYTVDFGATLTAAQEQSNIDGTDSAMATAYYINNTDGLKDEVIATATTIANLGTITALKDTTFDMTVNGVAITLNNVDIQAGDANGALVGVLNKAFSDAAIASIDGDASGLVASVNDKGELTITADDGRNINITVGTNASSAEVFSNLDTTSASLDVTAKGTISLTAKEGFSIGEIGGDKRSLAGIESAGGNVASADISTQAGAQEAISIFDRAIDTINDATGALGAANNRLDFTVANLSSIIENATASRSAIMDADFAAETAALSRAQVLQQAASAMLAQANALPSQVLSLLR